MPAYLHGRVTSQVSTTPERTSFLARLHTIAVVKNLVDNAIRYTREGGRVDLSVRVSEGKAVLRIQDSGPGIPLAERVGCLIPSTARWGVSRSGLSIVQTIANRIGAEIRLNFPDQEKQTSLDLTVLFPLIDSRD